MQVMHLHVRTAETAVYILSGQLPLVADLDTSVSWLRWEVCVVVIHLRGNLQNAKSYSKTKNRNVGFSLSVQFYLGTIDLLSTEISKKHGSRLWISMSVHIGLMKLNLRQVKNQHSNF